MDYCQNCGERVHPEQDRCQECRVLLSGNSIAGRSRRRFRAFVRNTALLLFAGAGVMLLSGFSERHVGITPEDCSLAIQAKSVSFDAFAEQSASRDDAVELLDGAVTIWTQLEGSYWPGKYSWALPNGEHAYLEAVLKDTASVRDLLAAGELVSAEIAERELTWKLRLLPQLCPAA